METPSAQPVQLSGWYGAPGSAPSGGAAPRGPDGADDTGSRRLAGEHWACTAPCVAQQSGVAAAVRGQLLWRTTERLITAAGSDAQAILAAYALRGPSFLELLHGSFALAILDSARGVTLLAVDRMGIERLCYSVYGGRVLFATSAEAVARAGGAPPRIGLQSLLGYLFFHMIPSADTIFEGVRKIPPATRVLFGPGASLSESVYWQPQFAECAGQSAAVGELREELHSALRAGVAAAQPGERSGAFLSGGLDSSTVAGYLGKVTGRPARTFSIGFGLAGYDELRYARIANAHFGCDAREYQVRPQDIVEQFAGIAAAYDEPFGNASAVPTLCCARLARESGVDHLLAGDGGDELFAGNKRYADQEVFERYQRVPGWFRRGLLEPTLSALPRVLRVGLLRKARNYVAQANTPLPERLESWNFLHRLTFDAVLHPDFAAAVDRAAPLEHMRAVYRAGSAGSHLNRMLNYDWRLTLADNDLRKVGTMCALGGIRVSYPMLHPDLVDVSLRVPPTLKMRGTDLRTFYRQAMADFLPGEILAKTKHGFGLPFGLWLQHCPPLAELIRDNLAGLRTRRLIRPEFLERLLRLHGEEDASYYGVLVWTLAMLEQWFREHRVDPA